MPHWLRRQHSGNAFARSEATRFEYDSAATGYRGIPGTRLVIGTQLQTGRVRLSWGAVNYNPSDRQVQDVVRRVRVLRDLMVSQCGVDPSTIECIAKDNVGRLCP